MGTKRLIFAIIVVILLIGGVIGGYYYLQNSSSQAAVLQQEMETLVKLDILNDEIDTKSKAFGNYGKVEESVKNYLYDVKNTYISMRDFCNEEQVEQVLSAENINGDPTELLVVKQKIDGKKKELQDLINKTENLRDNDQIMQSIKEKNLKDYYVGVYKSIMENENMQANLEAAENRIKDEQEEAEQRLEGLEDAAEFLAKNTKYWEVNDGKIQFTNTNKLAEYLEVLNGTK